MLVSSTSMKAAIATTTAISHGLTLGRQGSTGAGDAGLLPAGLSRRELEGPSGLSFIFQWSLLDAHPDSNDSNRNQTTARIAGHIESRGRLDCFVLFARGRDAGVPRIKRSAQ